MIGDPLAKRADPRISATVEVTYAGCPIVASHRGERHEEEFNSSLLALETTDGLVKTWMLEKDYEDVLRSELGEAQYQSLCQTYSKTRKPTRARLIASNPATAIPPRLVKVLSWLVDRAEGDSLGSDGQEVSSSGRGEMETK